MAACGLRKMDITGLDDNMFYTSNMQASSNITLPSCEFSVKTIYSRCGCDNLCVLMMAVLIGTIVQIANKGVFSPSGIFLFGKHLFLKRMSLIVWLFKMYKQRRTDVRVVCCGLLSVVDELGATMFFLG